MVPSSSESGDSCSPAVVEVGAIAVTVRLSHSLFFIGAIVAVGLLATVDLVLLHNLLSLPDRKPVGPTDFAE